MEITFTDNVNESLFRQLKPTFITANEIKFGVAFVKHSGLSLIEDDIIGCLKNGGKVEFLLGLDFRITDPKALRSLYDMSNSGLNIKSFCFSDPSIHDTPVYHPKIYLIRTKDRAIISVGSSNLTSGGLKDNIEINAIIKADIKEELVSDIYGIYNGLKFQKGRFEPDLEYIEAYEEAYKVVRKASDQALKLRSTQDMIKKMKKREKLLPKPKATREELFGWQKLVYEKLPDGVFETNDMYIHEKEFQQYYPENNFIKAKIRQILQQLRDLGLLSYISKNRWEKF